MMLRSPCFRVRIDHGQVAAFRKVLRDYDVEIYSFEQINPKEFLVAFEEPTMTLQDAKDFYPVASWVPCS